MTRYMKYAHFYAIVAAAAGSILAAAPAAAATVAAVSAADRAFVAKVSQGGMFEVEAGKLAAERAFAQDVKDIGNTEQHDHTLVGAKLKAIAAAASIPTAATLNASFRQKLAALEAVSGKTFDDAFIKAMDDIHAKDGAAFAQEAVAGTNGALRKFAAETHLIVERHLGSLHATDPK
jgi:putative membrane protein